LRNGIAWLRRQIETVRIRELVGEVDRGTAERRRLELTEEITRFEDAQSLLHGLQVQPRAPIGAGPSKERCPVECGL